MLLIFFFILIIVLTAYCLHRVRKMLGINDAVFYMILKNDKWIAESSWKDHLTGKAHSIITDYDMLNRIESVYDNNTIHYQSKEPSSDLRRIIHYHSRARQWYFNRLMLQYIQAINIREHFTVIYLQLCTRVLALKFPKIDLMPRIYKIFRSKNTELEDCNVEAARRMII